MKKIFGWRAAAVIFAVAGAIWLLLLNRGPEMLLKPGSAAVVAAGKQIYEASCAACHGTNLQGQPDWQTPLANGRMPAPPHDEDGHTWHHSERILFDITKMGAAKFIGKGYESDMMGFEGTLTDDEIIAVLSYIKSTWSAETRRRNDQVSRAETGN